MNQKSTWRDLLIALFLLIATAMVVMVVIKDQTSTPVKENDTNVDSLLNTNDSLKVVITYIDSVKNEEIQQVLKLDNDSTLELFKQLVSE